MSCCTTIMHMYVYMHFNFHLSLSYGLIIQFVCACVHVCGFLSRCGWVFVTVYIYNCVHPCIHNDYIQLHVRNATLYMYILLLSLLSLAAFSFTVSLPHTPCIHC